MRSQYITAHCQPVKSKQFFPQEARESADEVPPWITALPTPTTLLMVCGAAPACRQPMKRGRYSLSFRYPSLHFFCTVLLLSSGASVLAHYAHSSSNRGNWRHCSCDLLGSNSAAAQSTAALLLWCLLTLSSFPAI